MKFKKYVGTDDKNRQRAMLDYRLRGLTYAEIAKIVGVSRQRVQQVLRPPIQVYRFVAGRAKWKCEECRIPLKAGHIHHKDLLQNDAWNSIENLEYLCITCHRYRHMEGSNHCGREEKAVKSTVYVPASE